MRSYPIPTLRRKGNGVYFVRFAGRDHSLGSDESAARQAYATKIEEWAAWRAGVQAAAQAAASERSTRPGHLSVVQLSKQMLDAYTTEGRPQTARWFARHLKRWLHVHGQQRLLSLAAADPARGVFAPPVVALLNAYAADLAGEGRYSPRTINHDMLAVKRLFNYAADQGLAPAVNWRGVRRRPLPRAAPNDLAPALVAELIARAAKADPRLGPWLELNYLAMLRPSEVCAVVCAVKCGVHGGAERVPYADPSRKPRVRRSDVHAHAGHFLPLRSGRKLLESRGIFELSVHKTLHQGQGRFIVLSPQALAALDRCAPVWSTQNAYAAACRAAGSPKAPSVLRDSGASNLRALGVAREDVDRLLGHAPRGVSASYIREAWPHLWRQACRLKL